MIGGLDNDASDSQPFVVGCYKNLNDGEWSDLCDLQVEVVWGGRTNTFAWLDKEDTVLLQDMVVAAGAVAAAPTLQIPFGLETASPGSCFTAHQRSC
jgi:hypothetical protein